MTDTRTISQLEAEGYPWIGCECCKGTVWVPFRMIRQQIPMLSSWTLDELGAKMKCDKFCKRPERYHPRSRTTRRGLRGAFRKRYIALLLRSNDRFGSHSGLKSEIAACPK